MISLSLENLLDIVILSLNKMDARLTGHGERVAYGMLCLTEGDGRFTPEEICKITWTVLLHDIGSFRHTDISDLILREYNQAFSHARYGSLFLREFSPFPEYAVLLKYHHSSIREITSDPMEEKLKWLCGCLLVLDTLDLCQTILPSLHIDQVLSLLDRLDPERFGAGNLRSVERMIREYPKAAPKTQEEFHQALLARLKKSDLLPAQQELLLRTLVSSIDFRSRYTTLHCATMVSVSDTLAKLCGLDAHRLQAVHLGALLHDLGKIAIPAEILDSPGRLDGDNWKIMQDHVRITEELLQGRIDDEVLQIAVRHHETLDGQGYPRGLSSKDLTLPQRIVSVADVFSALSERRSYKEPFPLTDILNILNGMAKNGKLCPRTVEVCQKNGALIYENAVAAGKKALAVYETINRDYAAGL